MTKAEFLSELRARLSSLPEEDIQRATNFYSEAISDRMEDGLSEQEAIFAIGTPEAAAQSVLMDTPLPTLVRAQANETQRRSGISTAVWIILAIVLFPVWLPVLCVLFGLVIAVYAVLFGLLIAAVASVLGVIVAGIGMIVGGIAFGFTASPFSGLCAVGAALIAIGIGMLLIVPCIYIVKGIVWLIKEVGIAIKGLFVKGGKR